MAEEKKRILLTSPGALNNGGAQYVLMTIVRNLSSVYTFDILTFNSNQNYYNDEFLSYGGSIICFERKEEVHFLLKAISRFILHIKFKYFLSQLFKTTNYYAVHCNSQFTSCYILKYANKYGVKKRICHSHGIYNYTDVVRELFRNHFRKMIVSNANKLIGCSNIACDTLYHIKSGYNVIDNPYDDINIKYSEETPNHITLLQIGMFCENKNQAFSIKVLYCLKKKYPNVILRLVGTGDFTSLHKLADQLRVSDNIIFHKHNEDKMYLFRNSSFLIMPSISEGFGITLIEAQAAGLHCFASNTITEDTNCGGVIYYSLDDGPEKWANNIFTYYESYHGKKDRFDCSDYSISLFVNNIRDIYCE